ncbi:similar to Saccharomyces cerevisiae YGL089C MF(ALPHA)2 Mating pheromone alpha-factor, made by alpha cells [Maudiozyma saulgeensis]|uniref:Mating factor alpha n=1 Tax=Maudiozyma saulgeensis TaxID=1789683 RepID=A0A1X7QZX3_9SACH|nr:similar to Saccharomyces cerevisiae YGL089C MF(ALPHA)2 Mating pheromone alpha-factor, made by alpha cells [Kazachstania saulgeensis]
MKFVNTLSLLATVAVTLAAPVNITETSETSKATIPAEAIIGYLDLEGNKDVALLPFHNETSNGLMFVNTTIINSALAETEDEDLVKREAEAWHWLELDWGQPLYKRDANADADASAWHWLELDWGQPLYKREAEADADASAWHWLELDWGQPLYKRDANADADASAWHWLELDWGQPLY